MQCFCYSGNASSLRPAASVDKALRNDRVAIVYQGCDYAGSIL